MNEYAILLRYHEIALKGGNRSWFEERLAQNTKKLLHRALGREAPLNVIRQRGRVIAYCEWNEQAREAISHVFGATSFSPMRKVPTDLVSLAAAAVEEFEKYVQRHGMPRSFRVFTRRSEKALPETSMEIDRELGSAIMERHPDLKVDLKNPELVVGTELRHDLSYIWTEKVPGPGGLPVGTNGRVLSLLSGGLDSPVAAISILKRGASTSYIHFHGTPFVGDDVLEKVEDLARIVNRWQPDPEPLNVVPFGKIQEKIALATDPKLRTVLYRRMMVRIANRLAERLRAQALVTGESLGQVASQTLENLSTINASSRIPILRPLITLDKEEIIELARKWDTYETAIRPGLDCCTLFADRHPAIRTNIPLIEAEERKFPVDELVDEASSGIYVRRVD